MEQGIAAHLSGARNDEKSEVLAMTRCRTTLKGRTTKREVPDESGLINRATTKMWRV